MATRNEIVKQAQAWLGSKEGTAAHKTIIDTYNNDKPLPRGYKVKYTDAWCATFVSAVGIKCKAKDIILKECSCAKMIDLHKANGTWVENDAHVPMPGDLILYDWEDNGKGDDTGRADHIGIVEKVSGKTITVIEGNYSNKVKRRTMKVNGKYIRGYCVPKYESEKITFTPGERVKLAKNANVYGSTKKFSAWVYLTKLYVREVKGDRIVVSTKKTGAITGAVHKDFLIKV